MLVHQRVAGWKSTIFRIYFSGKLTKEGTNPGDLPDLPDLSDLSSLSRRLWQQTHEEKDQSGSLETVGATGHTSLAHLLGTWL